VKEWGNGIKGDKLVLRGKAKHGEKERKRKE
jgi:hypothetical protein